jgi:polyhydroxybutyrate depolymerase
MVRYAVSLLLIAITACGTATAETLRELPAGRRYRLIARGDHDARRPAPVLFALHAFDTDPTNLERRWGLRELAVERRGWLLAVPEGLRNSHGQPFWNATRACCDSERQAPEDLAYLRAVLADIRGRYAVDTTRVFAFGVSNGGFMAQRWACEPGGGLTGIVSVSGAGPGPDDPACAPNARLRVLHVHGDADGVVRYAGGAMNAPHPSARESVSAFLVPNGCAHDRAPVREPRRGLFEISTVEETWACPKGKLALWTVPEGGHQLRMGIGFTERTLEFLEAP